MHCIKQGKKRFISDEDQNGQLDVIDVDEKPPPPKRTTSVLTPSMQDELYMRLISG